MKIKLKKKNTKYFLLHVLHRETKRSHFLLISHIASWVKTHIWYT